MASGKKAKSKGHEIVMWRFGKGKCDKCGLIALNNDRTRDALKKPCPGSEGDEVGK